MRILYGCDIAQTQPSMTEFFIDVWDLNFQMTANDDGRKPGDALVLHVEDGLFLEDIDGELHLMDGSMD